MDYIHDIASVGAGAEAEDDAQAEIEAYDMGTLSMCGELEESAAGSRSKMNADIIQQHISELSEAVVNSKTAKTYARYSHSTPLPTLLYDLWVDCGSR